MIVNGAQGAESVAKTRLAGILPLRPSGNIELDPDAGQELLGGWSVVTDGTTEKQIALLKSQSGRIAIDGRAASDAQTLPDSGSLILSRRIGAGRVVQSRFDLTSDWLTTWGSFDSFVNGAILLRPRRQFVEASAMTDEDITLQRFVDYSVSRAEPTMNSRFRIAARDAILKQPGSVQTQTPSAYDPLTSLDVVKGVTAWNDNSDVVRTSRQILVDEAGIEIPDLQADRAFTCLLLGDPRPDQLSVLSVDGAARVRLVGRAPDCDRRRRLGGSGRQTRHRIRAQPDRTGRFGDARRISARASVANDRHLQFTF